ncbi:HAMP domain-containing histidine kinase [Actinoplanes hulinensis]|uniref:histidine kinase n=1 Tax=Actinoplanes hulinensis TaxID=1144547 RepID=A0ABS7B8B1_9ACTN|nr:HAMP domain-containing sensor histidine kinase [Actinoplanes hulinensis]MBW6437305.1 HAMP domain-containing histidine kinase [Actinoplanes hulinensis]MBW6437312.1 HAMP domain-containing histidine kinase [Actinoplanes hulinensis]
MFRHPAPRAASLSARSRIIGWMMLLVALALSAELLIAARVLTERAEAELDQELVHEGHKLRDYAGRTVDPATGKPYREVRGLLAGYLAEAVPDADETLFSLIDGRPAHRARTEPLARLDTDPQFVGRIAGLGQPQTGTVTSTAGPVRYAVFPVRFEGAPDLGALVVVEFAAPVKERVASTVRVLGVVSFVALSLAGLASWQVAGRVLAPIRTLRRTAETIRESDLDQRITVTGTDDVAALARTFNEMLDRLQSAFAGQRQFLDDASHELRTPITVIRGHLELISEDPAKRTRTLALVLDELQRMNRLVDDLMLLAKAERPDFLDLSEVDVTDLVMQVLAKASALGDRHWTVSGLTEQTVLADNQRLTQALMQLAANAVRHTRPTDRISIGASTVTDRLRLSVTDTGTGIAPEDRTRIFDRFTRLDHHGRRSRGGAGLGLAIVASIAHAHGGRVLLDSTPGKGSTFTLDLPLTPACRPHDPAAATTAADLPRTHR